MLLCMTVAHGYADEYIPLGHCGDDVMDAGTTNANIGTPISCAMALTPEMLSDYTICGVGKMQVGLSATDGLTSFRVWVRNHLNSDDLAWAEVPTEQLQKGWNVIDLPQLAEICPGDTLYCGYTYTQERKVACISYNGPKKTEYSFYISNGSLWGDMKKNYGPVSIRAGIMPRLDNAMVLREVTLSIRNQPYVDNGYENGLYHRPLIKVTVQNLGKNELKSFRIQHTDNGLVSEEQRGGVDRSGFGTLLTEAYSLTPGMGVTEPTQDIPLVISIDQLNGDPEAVLIGCCDTLYYDLTPDVSATQATTIIEEFTSELNGYAPLGQKRLREAISQSGLQDYVIISHHEGYGPADSWRVTQGSDYQASLFGPDKLTYVPAAVVNRRSGVFSTTLPTEIQRERILGSLQHQYVTADDPDAIRVSIEGRKVTARLALRPTSLTFCANPTLVCCIKQDRAASIAQNNYYPDEADGDYQLDAIRCYLHNVSGSDALLQGADMQAISCGQARVGDYVKTDEAERMVYEYQGTLPAGTDTAEGLTLVGYVYDKGNSNTIYATFLYNIE